MRQILALAGGQVVHGDDVGANADESLRDVRADKPCGARDNDLSPFQKGICGFRH